MDNIDFDKWCNIKKKTNIKKREFFVEAGDIVFIKIGKNIGYDQNGKGEEFLRPVLVLKVFNKSLFIGVALTSKEKKGKDFIKIDFYKKDKLFQSTAILMQIRTYDNKRIKYKKGSMRKKEFLEVLNHFKNVTLQNGENPEGN